MTYVALDDGKIGMRIEEIAEPHGIEGHHLVSRAQELGHENAALVAARTRHEDLHRLTAPRDSVRGSARASARSCSRSLREPSGNSTCARNRLAGLPISR